MITRNCVTCDTMITVTRRNPNRRYCSSRCRTADWHARNRRTRNGVANGTNDVGDAVHIRNDPPDAVSAANVTRCPHCRHELAVISVVIPADAAHVRTAEALT
jgi:hypothetical protein